MTLSFSSFDKKGLPTSESTSKMGMITRNINFTFLLIGVLFCTNLAQGKSRIDRIEPPFWYADLTDSLTVYVHGSGLDKCVFDVKDDQVRLASVHLFPNTNYAALNLVIPSSRKAGKINITDRGKSIFLYELKARSAFEPLPITSSDNMYLITPDRFANGNPANDQLPGYWDSLNRSKPKGRHGGDIQGIASHLDYLTDLGVTSVWINPLVENNQHIESYHGYAATNLYAIDPRFGSLKEYVDLSDSFRSHRISLVMDVVFNHIGSDHLWMRDLPDSNWINFHDTFTQTNYRAVTFIDPYASEKDRNRFSDGWFVRTMPDLNQRDPWLANYLTQNMIWWIETAHLSGIRIDTYGYPDNAFMRQLNNQLKGLFPNLFIFGEVWEVGDPTQAYYSPNKLPGALDQHLDGITDFQLYFAIQKWLREEEGWSEGLGRLYYTLASDALYTNPEHLVTFVDNHDQDRFLGQVNGDLMKWKSGLLFLLTTRGIPCVYYGTELLFKEVGDHGLLRQDMPGGWTDDTRSTFSAEGRSSAEREAYDFLQTLFKLRINHPNLFEGELLHFVPEHGVYTYFRTGGEEKLVVMFNNSDSDRQVDLSAYREVLPSDAQIQDVFRETNYKAHQPLTIKSKGFFVGMVK